MHANSPTGSPGSSRRCWSGAVKDPRLGFVTVTDARLTGDLRDATVYYTVYGPPEEHAATAAALESAKGIIRSEVGRQTGLRHTPSLTFVADTVPDNARHIEELLEQARVADADVARSREGALPAGDPDPYKTAADDDAASESGAGEARAWRADSEGEVSARYDLRQSPDGSDHEAGYSPS